jgi:hypothetical protein
MKILQLVRRSLLLLMGVFVVAILSVNIERLAEAKGWDKLLVIYWKPAMDCINYIVDQPWFWASFWTVVGATAGTWGYHWLSESRIRQLMPNVSGAQEVNKSIDFSKYDDWDPLRVVHAAQLWEDKAPAHNPTTQATSERFEKLRAAIKRGDLPAESEWIGVNRVTWVTRKDLRHFAVDSGEKPKFLFKGER